MREEVEIRACVGSRWLMEEHMSAFVDSRVEPLGPLLFVLILLSLSTLKIGLLGGNPLPVLNAVHSQCLERCSP